MTYLKLTDYQHKKNTKKNKTTYIFMDFADADNPYIFINQQKNNVNGN